MRGGRLVRQRGSGLWLPDDREVATLGRPRKDEQGYWVTPDGRRIPPIAGAAGPALDHALGSTGQTLNTSTSPISLSPSNAVPLGDLLIAYGGVNGANNAGTPTFSDSGPNAYSLIDGTLDANNSDGVWFAAAQVTHALTTSSTISFAAAWANVSRRAVAAASFTGCDPNAVANAYANNRKAATVSTTTPTISTSAPVKAGDLVFCAIFWGNSAVPAVTQPGTWAGLSTFSTAADALLGAWFVAPATGIVTYNPTMSNAATNGYQAAIAAFPALRATGNFLPLL